MQKVYGLSTARKILEILHCFFWNNQAGPTAASVHSGLLDLYVFNDSLSTAKIKQE
jgi:hypothetical protein